MVDWEADRLRTKARIEAADEEMERLSCRRGELAVRSTAIADAYLDWPIALKDADRVRERLHEAADRARAAQLAAVDQLELTAAAHDALAVAHDSAAKNAQRSAIEHKHVAEAHRCAARHDRGLASQYRERAELCGDD